MSLIERFQKVRRDGKVVEESMTPEEMIRAGWMPDKVVMLRWAWYDRTVELSSPFGFLARVVASREYIAVLEDTDASGQNTALTVYQANGAPYATYQNVVHIAGKPEAGRFATFRLPQSGVQTTFSVLFDVFRNGARFQVEIDAASGAVMSAVEVR